MSIHPTAILDPQARIDVAAEIGPYCVIGAEVEIGARTRLMAHVYVEGPARIGEENLFYPYSSVGVASQDKKYKGERAETRIGNRNTVREFVTIHRGTGGGGALTAIGDGNLLMAYAHVAHDVRIGNDCVIANGVTFGGHVTVGDQVTLGAFTGVHQFCRIGRQAMVGGYSVITRDVLPFSLTVTEREARVFGANKTGLERRGFPAEAVEALQKAFRLLTHSQYNTTQALAKIREEPMSEEVKELLAFITASERGFVK